MTSLFGKDAWHYVRASLATILAGPLACAAAAQTEPDSPAPAKNSIKLVKVLMALPAGNPWLTLHTGSLCFKFPHTYTWDGSREEQDIAPYATVFKTELERAGFKVVTPGEDNLFEHGAAADYEAAAVITEAHIDGCMTRGGLVTERGDIRGNASLKIDWQVYARLKKQVVARASTEGNGHLADSIPGGVARLSVEAFTGNVRALSANADFRAAMAAPRPFTAGFQMPGEQSKIALAGSLKAGPRRVDEAVASVVTVINSQGSGSGILVSDDGYILTNAHVVGDDKDVRLRWSDGIETLGKVERVAKQRDVAIIKTNPRERAPLAVKRSAVTPGQRVYAIGSPNGKEFQGTVSSGIVSANRVIDGMRFIQRHRWLARCRICRFSLGIATT